MSWNDLPPEIKLHIVSYLDLGDLLKFRLLNQESANLTRDDKLWKNLLKRDFSLLECEDSWYESYKDAYSNIPYIQVRISLHGLTFPKSIAVLKYLSDNNISYISPYQNISVDTNNEENYLQEISWILKNRPDHEILTYINHQDIEDAQNVD
jgi:hypothetical protein